MTARVLAVVQTVRTPVTPRQLALAVGVVLVLAVLPLVLPPFQTIQLSYGLAFAIAALVFKLLHGYTGQLS
jgi:ABC-type branched-subunit amino acid transport system permease subunit